MLAIVIPYYRFRFFRETLESLAKQSNKNFHVYIGNDASPEDPIRIIASYSKFLKIDYRKFEHNLGSNSLTRQWERCISFVGDEEWIMVLGDDDKLESTVVESFYSRYSSFCRESNLVRFASQTINSTGDAISPIFYHPEFEDAEQSQFKRMLGFTRSSLSEYVFRKSTYLRKGFRDLPLAWHSDDLAWLDFSANKPIFTINDCTIYVRNSDHNISGKIDNFDLKDQATLKFYKILITEKSALYSNQQMGVILKRYEELLFKRKELSLKTWQFLLLNYLTKAEVKNPLHFLKRSLKRRFLY